MINIICVKYGIKYNHVHVNRLYEMVRRNVSLPFSFYCLTDNVTDINDKVICVPIDLSLELETYWYKLCVFDNKIYGNDNLTLYLDLDTIIQNNIDHFFDKVVSHPIRTVFTGEPRYYDGMKWKTGINSSIMLFKPSMVDHIRFNFLENIDFNILEFEGVCRYLWQNHKEDLVFFDVMKDHYSLIKISQFVEDKFDYTEYKKKYKVRDRLFGKWTGFFVPEASICMLNGCSEHGAIDEAYEYFSDYY